MYVHVGPFSCIITHRKSSAHTHFIGSLFYLYPPFLRLEIALPLNMLLPNSRRALAFLLTVGRLGTQAFPQDGSPNSLLVSTVAELSNLRDSPVS